MIAPPWGRYLIGRGIVMQRTISKTSLADECRKRAAECSETALQQQDPGPSGILVSCHDVAAHSSE